jgi:hypothetical protein
MSKTKTQFETLIQPLGMALMSIATIVGMVEVPEHNTKAVLTSRPVFAFAGANEMGNPIRREKESEVGAHYVSYSSFQRTPGRTGKI